MSESEYGHPLEALHRGRDAVSVAVSGQSRIPHPSLDGLYAYGSAIVATLAQLQDLSSVLAEQVGRLDEEELERAKTSDDPADKLRVAGTHLSRLSDSLASAATDAGRFWATMEHIDRHTASDVRARRDPDT